MRQIISVYQRSSLEESYLQGKFPLLVLPDGRALPESEAIVQYLLTVYKDVGPSLTASDPYAQAVATLVTRILDVYIGNIQACMYRAMPSAEQRAKEIGTIAYQLDAIEVRLKDFYVIFEHQTQHAASVNVAVSQSRLHQNHACRASLLGIDEHCFVFVCLKFTFVIPLHSNFESHSCPSFNRSLGLPHLISVL